MLMLNNPVLIALALIYYFAWSAVLITMLVLVAMAVEEQQRGPQ